MLYYGIIYRKKGGCLVKPLKESVCITLDDNIISKIKELSEEDDRSFSQYINLVLKEHIDRILKDKKQG